MLIVAAIRPLGGLLGLFCCITIVLAAAVGAVVALLVTRRR